MIIYRSYQIRFLFLPTLVGVKPYILVYISSYFLKQSVRPHKLKQCKRISRINVWQIWCAISVGKVNRKGIEIGQWPRLRGRTFRLLILWDNILIRLNKVCIIGRTFTAYCGGLITIRSYMDTLVETRVNVLIFAHGPQ